MALLPGCTTSWKSISLLAEVIAEMGLTEKNRRRFAGRGCADSIH